MPSAELARRFKEVFGESPNIFAAPGRVNLIGEHTDYNQGFVMPCALEFRTQVAVAPRNDEKLVIRSSEFSEEFIFDSRALPEQRTTTWCDYVLGVIVTLQRKGYPIAGANVLVHGEVPIGAGLSSSAAVEVATALAFMDLGGVQLALPKVAELCQAAENMFVGARCGIMDQFVSCLGRANHALLLDCRSLDFRLVPIPADVRIVVCNTMVKHALASGEYNARRAECEEGVHLLSVSYPQIQSLRDVTTEQLEAEKARLPGRIYQRCLHVVSENARTQAGARALEAGELPQFGRLMAESHRSLRDLYEVSCRELDVMVESAQGLPWFWGGRMTGGGFGGCTVNLVAARNAPDFAVKIADRYQKVTGIKPEVYVCAAADGAGVESHV